VKSLLLALLGTAILWQPALARNRSGLDTQLVEGAKKEKKLVFYTTLDLPQTISAVYEFVQKYPFMDLEVHPLETEALVERVQIEARNAMPGWDVVIGGGGLMQPLLDERLLSSYLSPERESVSRGLKDGAGFWSAFYINHFALGYNKTLVKQEEVPKTYEDLLEPRWKDSRIALDGTSHGILRGLAASWGEDKAVGYLKRLAQQKPVVARASIVAVESMHIGNVSMVIARAPVIQGYIEKLNSPIHWVTLEPVIAQIDAVMLSAQPPHPNAARLFIDFVLSREGQSAINAIQQIPVRRDMQPASNPMVQGHKWFVERPDKHVNFQETVRLFREIFGIQ
jgi:iron(III) transport system substrate-binding protein